MKQISLLVVVLALTGCVSAREVDSGNAFDQCRSIADKNFRDRCIAEALQDAERDRRAADEDRQQDVEDAERRELNRFIGGVEQD
ncbi:MAG: hypothetical protein QNI84_10110 [Henriciella sp.]|nr:hypothetical protein [Henriciella sp.]